MYNLIIYLLLTYYVYAFELLSNSDWKFFIIRHYYEDSIIELIYKYITFALLLLCNPLPVLIHIIVDTTLHILTCRILTLNERVLTTDFIYTW